MKKYIYPQRSMWQELTERCLLDTDQINDRVSDILQNVKEYKDGALLKYGAMFDGVELELLQVSEEEIQYAGKDVSEELKRSIELARQNIFAFHESQQENTQIIENTQGVKCWRQSLPIEKVGLYIPGGTAPLFSTILMLAIPAKIAGCQQIVLCTPPNKDGKVNSIILYVANALGINHIYKVGGAQAIAAMAYGTETIPQVYKVFGPGNQYVTKAKKMIQSEGIAIDMPAGPSEVLVIADESCHPGFVAADLLSQAEHGIDSQAILVTDSQSIADAVGRQLDIQLASLPRKDLVVQSLMNSRIIILEDIKSCFEFSNLYAPEHLIIASDDADEMIDKVINAGSVFLGNYSCESAGDYASGTNHTLPTYGYAKSYSGVSLDSFIKKITFQKLDSEGIQNIGPAIEIMAEAEGLQAHKNAVSIRLKYIENE